LSEIQVFSVTGHLAAFKAIQFWELNQEFCISQGSAVTFSLFRCGGQMHNPCGKFLQDCV